MRLGWYFLLEYTVCPPENTATLKKSRFLFVYAVNYSSLKENRQVTLTNKNRKSAKKIAIGASL